MSKFTTEIKMFQRLVQKSHLHSFFMTSAHWITHYVPNSFTFLPNLFTCNWRCVTLSERWVSVHLPQDISLWASPPNLGYICPYMRPVVIITSSAQALIKLILVRAALLFFQPVKLCVMWCLGKRDWLIHQKSQRNSFPQVFLLRASMTFLIQGGRRVKKDKMIVKQTALKSFQPWCFVKEVEDLSSVISAGCQFTCGKRDHGQMTAAS